MDRFETIRLYSKLYALFNIFIFGYLLNYNTISDTIYSKFYFLMIISNFKMYTMMNDNTKYIYILIWSKLCLAPIISIYGMLYYNALGIYTIALFLDIIFGYYLAFMDICKSPLMSSFLIPVYYINVLNMNILDILGMRSLVYIFLGFIITFMPQLLISYTGDIIIKESNDCTMVFLFGLYFMIYGLYNYIISVEMEGNRLVQTAIIEKICVVPLYLICYTSGSIWRYISHMVIVIGFGTFLLKKYGDFSLMEYIIWLYYGTEEKVKSY